LFYIQNSFNQEKLKKGFSFYLCRLSGNPFPPIQKKSLSKTASAEESRRYLF